MLYLPSNLDFARVAEWQTHMTQNHAGNHAGSSPTIGTNDVSVRTNRTDRYENQSVKWLIFSFAKNHPKTTMKGWCKK